MPILCDGIVEGQAFVLQYSPGGGGGGGWALRYRGGPHPRYVFRGRRGLF